ncbi:MAG: hypothetical protein ACP5LP_02555 [Candidatus Micrarchaeia archaeon]
MEADAFREFEIKKDIKEAVFESKKFLKDINDTFTMLENSKRLFSELGNKASTSSEESGFYNIISKLLNSVESDFSNINKNILPLYINLANFIDLSILNYAKNYVNVETLYVANHDKILLMLFPLENKNKGDIIKDYILGKNLYNKEIIANFIDSINATEPMLLQVRPYSTYIKKAISSLYENSSERNLPHVIEKAKIIESLLKGFSSDKEYAAFVNAFINDFGFNKQENFKILEKHLPDIGKVINFMFGNYVEYKIKSKISEEDNFPEKIKSLSEMERRAEDLIVAIEPSEEIYNKFKNLVKNIEKAMEDSYNIIDYNNALKMYTWALNSFNYVYSKQQNSGSQLLNLLRDTKPKEVEMDTKGIQKLVAKIDAAKPSMNPQDIINILKKAKEEYESSKKLYESFAKEANSLPASWENEVLKISKAVNKLLETLSNDQREDSRNKYETIIKNYTEIMKKINRAKWLIFEEKTDFDVDTSFDSLSKEEYSKAYIKIIKSMSTMAKIEDIDNIAEKLNKIITEYARTIEELNRYKPNTSKLLLKQLASLDKKVNNFGESRHMRRIDQINDSKKSETAFVINNYLKQNDIDLISEYYDI